MALLARKIFTIVVISQIGILLVYVIVRNLPTSVVRRHSVNSGTLHIPPPNITHQDMHLFFQHENNPKITEVSTKSQEKYSVSRGLIVNQTTHRLDATSGTTSGGGETTRNTTAKKQTTPKATMAPYRITERKAFDQVKTNESFQKIDGKDAWLYSAFFDYVAEQQGRPSVRLFGIIQRTQLQTVFCNLSTEKGNVVTKGSVSEFPDSHGVSFPPVSVQCSLPVNVRPTHVSVSFQTNITATNRLQIIYPGTLVRNFTVCFSVLHSGYKWTSQLIQSLEMNRILGAEHFMVYNYSISPAVDQILQHYQQEGLVTVLPWPVPTKQSWYYGQMSALNDCVYRNRNISRFIVVVDTDELVIPRNHSNWMEMIAATSPQEYDVSTFLHSPNPSKKASAKTGCFMVRSSFFTATSKINWNSIPPEFPFSEEEKNNTIKYNIMVLHQFLRSADVYRAKVKSKYFARPELTHTCGIHLVHTFTYFMRCHVVSDSIALLHHYRKPTIRGGIIDTTILKFKSQLYPRVLEKYKLFPQLFSSS